LSEARAKAVAAKLVEMGVPESQLIVEGKGGVDVEKPIQLNRRVIIAPAK
jgi:outer membrane protein OmpA-like peptidoglycan-associated protein